MAATSSNVKESSPILNDYILKTKEELHSSSVKDPILSTILTDPELQILEFGCNTIDYVGPGRGLADKEGKIINHTKRMQIRNASVNDLIEHGFQKSKPLSAIIHFYNNNDRYYKQHKLNLDQIVEKLLKAGAHVNPPPPFTYEDEDKPRNRETFKILLDFGANIAQHQNEGQTLLDNLALNYSNDFQYRANTYRYISARIVEKLKTGTLNVANNLDAFNSSIVDSIHSYSDRDTKSREEDIKSFHISKTFIGMLAEDIYKREFLSGGKNAQDYSKYTNGCSELSPKFWSDLMIIGKLVIEDRELLVASANQNVTATSIALASTAAVIGTASAASKVSFGSTATAASSHTSTAANATTVPKKSAVSTATATTATASTAAAASDPILTPKPMLPSYLKEKAESEQSGIASTASAAPGAATATIATEQKRLNK